MRRLAEDRFLAELRTKDALHAAFLDRVINGINSVAAGAGVAVTGDADPPPPVNAITLKANGEMVHVTLAHGAEVSRAIHYFLEADNSPSFPQPHVMELKSSRGHVFHLPALNDSGVQQPWYFRAYAQNPGSKPSAPTVLGGLANPTAVMLKGTTAMTLLPSTGSGTASSTGQQGGSGLGKQRISTPKVVRVGRTQQSNAPVSPPTVNPALHLLAAVASASQTTSLSQAGTTARINVAAGIFNLGNLAINTFASAVPITTDITGAALTFTTYFVFHDDPNLAGGNVTYQATTDPTQLAKGTARFYDGSITLAVGGGGTGGGTGGGGGRHSSGL